ncbi:hypothetical protein [Companilactobacillus sp. HBUAS56275]|jgi:hypothetical protein|uniref:Uncharacterized protein n=1 Tax=Candidatus Companilactobacillus pullicola TaxID=2838523 RepID=A0A9D2CPB7_9LACO|nr:hypothetical protein [Candidatus Companilactobacillus pullicola]
MRKIIEIAPTIILLIMMIVSLILRASGRSWIYPFALGLLGLCIYPAVTLVIESIRTRSDKKQLMSKSESILIWYLAIVAALFLSLTTYLMVV